MLAAGRIGPSGRLLDWKWCLDFGDRFITQTIWLLSKNALPVRPLEALVIDTLPSGITRSIPEPFHHDLNRRSKGTMLLFGL
jgi:hypothetical protein